MKLWHLAALHDHRRNTIQTIEAWLQFVSRHFPELGLGNGIGCEAVSYDRKTGERQAMSGDCRRGRQIGTYTAEGCIHELQRFHHVDVPVEEKIYFRVAATGDGTDRSNPRDTVNRLLNRSCNGDHHLVDGHHSVIYADDNSRKIGLRKNRNRNLERNVSTRYSDCQRDEDDGLGESRVPIAVVPGFRSAKATEEVEYLHT